MGEAGNALVEISGETPVPFYAGGCRRETRKGADAAHAWRLGSIPVAGLAGECPSVCDKGRPFAGWPVDRETGFHPFLWRYYFCYPAILAGWGVNMPGKPGNGRRSVLPAEVCLFPADIAAPSGKVTGGP